MSVSRPGACLSSWPGYWFYRAMLCMRGTSHEPVAVSLSVCVCVCLSVTNRCSTKTAKHRITQTTPQDSPGTVVFFWTSICSGLVVQVVSALLRGSWQDFNWHNASRDPWAIAELLGYNTGLMMSVDRPFWYRTSPVTHLRQLRDIHELTYSMLTSRLLRFVRRPVQWALSCSGSLSSVYYAIIIVWCVILINRLIDPLIDWFVVYCLCSQDSKMWNLQNKRCTPDIRHDISQAKGRYIVTPYIGLVNK